MRFTQPLSCISKGIGELTKKYANLPERYIRRVVEQVESKTPNLPEYIPKEVKRKYARFTQHRPWTEEWVRQVRRGGRPALVEPIKEWSIFKGDRVEVLVGRDKGKQGIVCQIVQERNWCYVEGLNWKYKTVGETDEFPGIVIRSELPLLVTNQVQLVDPADEKPAKIEWRYTEDGEKVRVSLRTGRIIPMPRAAEETYDYKTPETYRENVAKDTKADDVQEITFKPCLKTFEMDIMDTMGIKEDRIPKKSYWY